MRVSFQVIYQILKLGIVILLLVQLQGYWQYWQSTSIIYATLALAGNTVLSGLGRFSTGVSASSTIGSMAQSHDPAMALHSFPDFSATVDMENAIFSQMIEQSVFRGTFAVDIVKAVTAAESLISMISVLNLVDLHETVDNLTGFLMNARLRADDLHLLSSTVGSSVKRFIDQFFDAASNLDVNWSEEMTPAQIMSMQNFHDSVLTSMTSIERLLEEIDHQVTKARYLNDFLARLKQSLYHVRVKSEFKIQMLSKSPLAWIGAKRNERQQLDDIIGMMALVERWTVTTAAGITSTGMWLGKVRTQLTTLTHDVSAGLGTDEVEVYERLQRIALDIVRLQRALSEPPVPQYAQETLSLSSSTS